MSPARATFSSLIKTKSVHDLKGPDDGVRILVTRYFPSRLRGFTYSTGMLNIWARQVGPPPQVLQWYKSKTITAERFTALYLDYMKTSKIAQADLEFILRPLRQGKTVTLLCYEPEDGVSFCHRHLLKEFILDKLSSEFGLEKMGESEK